MIYAIMRSPRGVCVLDSELRNVVVDHYIGYGNVHDACYVLMIHPYYIIGRYYLNSVTII
jgi:hypothetical protein